MVPLVRQKLDPLKAEIVKVQTRISIELIHRPGRKLLSDPQERHERKDDPEVSERVTINMLE